MKRATYKQCSALTLIELLAAIAIVAILVTLLTSVFGTFQNRSNYTKCVANLRTIGGALSSFVADNAGRYPEAGSGQIIDPEDGNMKITGVLPIATMPPNSIVYTGTRLSPYISNLKVFLCPSSEDAKSGWCGYGYNGGYLGGREVGGGGSMGATGAPATLGAIENPAGTVAVMDSFAANDIQSPSGNRGGYNWEEYARWQHSGGMNVLWCDGHVDWRSKDDEYLNAPDDRAWAGRRSLD